MTRNGATVALLLTLLSSASASAGLSSLVQGTVKDKATGQPIVGATVRLHVEAPEAIFYTAQTDNNGRFRFTEAGEWPRGTLLYLSAEKEGYVPNRPNHLYGRAEPPTCCAGPPRKLFTSHEGMVKALGVFSVQPGRVTRVAIELERAGSLAGTVSARLPSGMTPYREPLYLQRPRDPETEAALKEPMPTVAQVVPDASGAFEVKGLAPGTNYQLMAFSLGQTSRVVAAGIVVNAGQVAHIEPIVDYTDNTGIVGTIRVSGPPASTLSGLATLRSTSPGQTCLGRVENGAFSCLGVPPGSYQVKVSAYDAQGVLYEGVLQAQVQAGQTRSVVVDLTRVGSTQ